MMRCDGDIGIGLVVMVVLVIGDCQKEYHDKSNRISRHLMSRVFLLFLFCCCFFLLSLSGTMLCNCWIVNVPGDQERSKVDDKIGIR